MGRRAGFAPFAFVSAAYFAHIGFFNPYLPLWLQHMGQPLWVIGILTSVQSFTRVFMPYVWGWLSDKTGQPVLCIRIGGVAALLGCCGLWAYSLLSTPTFVGLALGLLALFTPSSAIMPTSEAIMTARLQTVNNGFDAARYGRIRVWGSLGFLVTVLSAGALFEHFGMDAFLPVACLSLVLLVCSVFSLKNVRQNPSASLNSSDSVQQFLRQDRMRWFFASVFLHVLSHMGMYLFLSLWLDANGYSKTAIGALWALGVGAEVVVLYAQGPLLARLTWVAWLVLCAAACALRMGSIAWGVGSVAVLVLAQCLHGLSFATHHTAVMAVITESFSAHMRSRGQALYAIIGYGASGVVGGVLGAAISERFGLPAVFAASVFTSAVAGYCAWRMGKSDSVV